MTDPSAPAGAAGAADADEPLPGAAVPSWRSSGGRRVAAAWHGIRSGEDPLAFGAVVVVLALVAGLLWFWAGTRHDGVAAAASPGPAASASPDAAAATAGRSGAESARRADGRAGPFPLDSGEPSPVPGTVTTGPALAVHVAGAVAHPGLYHLPAGSRVADALALAGGSVTRADLDRLNLAARLGDGQRVYVARRGEPVPPEPAVAGIADGASGDEGTSEPVEPIDLNAAGLAALDSLPGVGPSTARAILEERARRGGFRSTRDLLRVPGIGEGRFARLKEHIRV